MIDGARSKWCFLLLLNAIVGILDFESFNLAARRKFNQQQILFDCIKAELAENGVHEDICENETLTASLDTNWSDLKLLRKFLENNAPYKSKEKYLGILDILLSHQVIELQGFDIARCINTAINKILSSANRKPSRRQVLVAPVVKSKRVLSLKTVTVVPVPVKKEPKPRKAAKLETPAKKRSSPQFDDDIPQSTKKRSRRQSPRAPAITKSPPTRALPARLTSFPSVPDRPLRAMDRDHDSVPGFAFHGEHFFNEHEDIDPNAQPWELLETVPEVRNPSPHFRHPASARGGGAPSVRSFGSPFLASSGLGEPFRAPASLSLMSPEACRMMLPFPDCEVLHPMAQRMNPFPIDDGMEAEAEDDEGLEVHSSTGSSCEDEASYDIGRA